MKCKKYVDESYAFWTNEPEETLYLHLNEWYSPPKCNIDIGVRVCAVRKAKVLNVYIPFNIERTDIRDLFEDMQNKDTACAIFNSVCDIATEGGITVDGRPLNAPELNGVCCRIAHQERVDYMLRLSDDIVTVEDQYDGEGENRTRRGAVITVDFSRYLRYLEGCDLYFRFRLPHPPLQKNNLKRGVSSGAYIETPNRNTKLQYMQRINEVRSLPESLRKSVLVCPGEKAGAASPTNASVIQLQTFGKVMSMLAANRKFEIDDSGCYKIRQLEAELHKDYIPEQFKDGRDAIVYQWKEENKAGQKHGLTHSFVFPIRILRDKFSFPDFAVYLIETILVSTLTSIVWMLLSRFF